MKYSFKIASYKFRTGQILTFLVFTFLFLFSAFRPENIGTDTESYVQGFLYQGFLDHKDLGYKVFCSILAWVWLDPRILFITTSFIVVFCFYRAIRNYSTSFWFSSILFILLFYIPSLNIMRQYLVIALYYCLAINLLKNNKALFYFLLVIILSTFHISALILILPYFFRNIDLGVRTFFIIWFVSFIFFVAGLTQLLVITGVEFLANHITLDPQRMDYVNRITDYLLEAKTNKQLYAYNVIFGIVLFNYQRVKEYNNNAKLFLLLSLIGIVFRNLFDSFHAVERLALYFEISYIFTFAYVIAASKVKNNRIIFRTIFLGYALSYFSWVYVYSNHSEVLNLFTENATYYWN